MSLTRDQILAKLKERRLPIEKVDCPEWGGEIYVRGMDGLERDAFESSYAPEVDEHGRPIAQDTNAKSSRARLLVACACDQDGNLLFKAEDIPVLSKEHWVALQPAAAAAQRLNRTGSAQLEKLKGESGPVPGEKQS